MINFKTKQPAYIMFKVPLTNQPSILLFGHASVYN